MVTIQKFKTHEANNDKKLPTKISGTKMHWFSKISIKKKFCYICQTHISSELVQVNIN